MDKPEEIEDSSTLEWGKKKKAKSVRVNTASQNVNAEPYSYEEMLRLLYDKLKDAPIKTIAIPAPKLAKVGGARIRITNFENIMEAIHRDKEHVACFINAELGVVSSVAADGALTIKGKFTTSQIESIIKKYIWTYVVCKACQSYHTHFQRDTKSRALMLVCEQCQSAYVPPPLKTVISKK
jgi:translation initiation factor 2 subunit 2